MSVSELIQDTAPSWSNLNVASITAGVINSPSMPGSTTLSLPVELTSGPGITTTNVVFSRIGNLILADVEGFSSVNLPTQDTLQIIIPDSNYWGSPKQQLGYGVCINAGSTTQMATVVSGSRIQMGPSNNGFLNKFASGPGTSVYPFSLVYVSSFH